MVITVLFSPIMRAYSILSAILFKMAIFENLSPSSITVGLNSFPSSFMDTTTFSLVMLI